MKKKVIVIISIIVLLVFIPLAIIGGIKYRNYVAEIETVELPEIVFEKTIIKTDNTFVYYVIDIDGNIYLDREGIPIDEMIQLYKEEKLSDNMEYIKTIDSTQLKRKYMTFLELCFDSEYTVTPADNVSMIISPHIFWKGYYYDDKNEVMGFDFFYYYVENAEVTDERGKELADWITDTVLD